MKLTISEQAANWYKNELELNDGDFIRFYVRYGGMNQFQKGFSLGISNDIPEHPGIEAKMDGITFFIEKNDLWYLNDANLSISYNPYLDEPQFKYES